MLLPAKVVLKVVKWFVRLHGEMQLLLGVNPELNFPFLKNVTKLTSFIALCRFNLTQVSNKVFKKSIKALITRIFTTEYKASFVFFIGLYINYAVMHRRQYY